MPQAQVHKPQTLTDYVELIQTMQRSSKSELWFRGCGRADHALLPSFYRHPAKKTDDDFRRLEKALITRFAQRSIPFHDRPLSEGWDTLFFMQHHGVPTRLLDWSENPFIAFYFAVMSAARDEKDGYLADAAVWVLNPSEWNQHALKGQSYKDGILSTNDSSLVAYASLDNHANMPNAPLAMFGTHNSQRIVAQRGVFTVFGKAPTPMERIFSHDNYPKTSLKKLILSHKRLKSLRDQILTSGITESVVMPDLEGLAREIRRQFGFDY